MKGSFRKRGCKCSDKKKCKCGATWSFRIDVGQDPVTGERIPKNGSGFKTKGDAEIAAAKLLTEYKNGTYISEKNLTVEEFSEQWLKIYAATGNVRDSTVDIRRAKLKIILKYFKKIKIKNVTKKMYQDMLIDLKEKGNAKKKGYAKKTIESVHETGLLFFAAAVELEIIAINPTLNARVPAFPQVISETEEEAELPEYLEKEELAVFLRTAKENDEDMDYPLFLLLAYTGIRVGELSVLKWRDIDSKQNTISITKTLYHKRNDEGRYALNPPKTKKSKRVIDIEEAVLDELEKHRARQNIIRMEKRKTYYDKDFVFPHDEYAHGYPQSQIAINRRMKRILKMAGLNITLSPHSLRHTHCSLLAEAGVSLETIMQRLGHKSDRVTREIYLHVTKTQKKEASQKFGALMSNL